MELVEFSLSFPAIADACAGAKVGVDVGVDVDESVDVNFGVGFSVDDVDVVGSTTSLSTGSSCL